MTNEAYYNYYLKHINLIPLKRVQRITEMLFDYNKTNQEIGTIVEENGRMYLVRFPRKSACDKCGFCKLGSQEAFLWIESDDDLSVGQRVVVEMAAQDVLKGSVILYLFPLVFFFAGFFAGFFLQKHFTTLSVMGDFFPLASGFLFLIGSLYLIFLYDKKLKKSPVKIIKILH